MMQQPQIRLCLVLHNHQPVGNFDNVFEASYRESYLPFLDVFEPFEKIRISLHISGPLVRWLQQHHPEYLARIARLVSVGRIEILGGAYYEPILAMITQRDRIGQIRHYTQWLESNLGAQIHGMWIPERVWEAEFASDLARADIKYTVLDDFHFRRAGLSAENLTGYYVTENEGRTVRVFPGSEKLRYLIPFGEPGETIEFCRQLAAERPGSAVVFGDDGEKFGTWPDTYAHVYEQGWLRQFFELLTTNSDWLVTSTLAEAVAQTPSQGKIFLPDASYREMTEWSLPVEKQIEFDHLQHDFAEDARWPAVRSYMAGGFWRNFKVKYPESNEMYARMMYVSHLLESAESKNVDPSLLESARDHLYRGQCNCSYWHGAFGGIYLPHLRNAVYHHLIAAENILEGSLRESEAWIECTADDYDFDGCQEVRLANDQLVGWLAPQRGGMLYELDLRDSGHNLLATMQRRPEAYHEKVRQGQKQHDGGAASIHDRVVFKQEGLENRLDYDHHLRKSLIDHCWDLDVNVDAIASGNAREHGDFVHAVYDATIRRKPDRIQVMMQRKSQLFGQQISLAKGITLNAGSHDLEIAYMIEGLPPNFEFHFGVEFNFAGMPAGQDDRYFRTGRSRREGQLGAMLDLQAEDRIELVDEWLGLVAGLAFDAPCGIWTFPIQSVSQSESGFELVHQSVVVQPHWIVRGDSNGRWVTKMVLSAHSDVPTQRLPNEKRVVAETH